MRNLYVCVMFFFCGVQMDAQYVFPKSAGEDTSQVMGEEYWKQWNPELQQQIDRNIETYRKANAEVQLPDVDAGAEVHVEQISHDFLFGAHIFNFDQLGADDLNRKYKHLYGTLFNSATIAFYWKTFEPEPGKPRFKATSLDDPAYWNYLPEPWKEFHWRRPSPEKIIEFCEAKDIQMHGHPIIWGNTNWNHPSWVSKAPDKVGEMERLFEKRIDEITKYYGGRIQSWDIVNESVDPVPGKPRYGVVPEDYTFKSFKRAEEGFPGSVLFNINDSWREVYPPFIDDLMKRGAKIDVVGLQMHIFRDDDCVAVAEGKEVKPNGTSWKPEDIMNYLKKLDAFERPIHLSEITIPSPGTDEKSNMIQAILTYHTYRLWFSWPSMHRITWWNVVDDCGLTGEPTRSGLFTRQMEPKPAFHAMNQLIHHEWKTHLFVKPDKKGTLKFCGFKGNYRITWKDKRGNTQTMAYHLK